MHVQFRTSDESLSDRSAELRQNRIVPDQLNRKTDLAKRFQCSTRQIELMVADGRLPKPFYLGDASPRWRQADIDAWLERLATGVETVGEEASRRLRRNRG